jgi:hypothetical protein
MTWPLVALTVAWLVQAVVSSGPWMVMARPQLVKWAFSPRMWDIVGLHSLGCLCPLLAAILLSFQRRIAAALSLGLIAGAWLCWHGAALVRSVVLSALGLILSQPVAFSGTWLVRDSGRILLSIATLLIVPAVLRQAPQAQVLGAIPDAGTRVP